MLLEIQATFPLNCWVWTSSQTHTHTLLQMKTLQSINTRGFCISDDIEAAVTDVTCHIIMMTSQWRCHEDTTLWRHGSQSMERIWDWGTFSRIRTWSKYKMLDLYPLLYPWINFSWHEINEKFYSQIILRVWGIYYTKLQISQKIY